MNIVIVEDEVQQQLQMSDFIHRFLNERKVSFKINCFSDGESFLASYLPGKADLLFMDIQLGDNHLNGMEISKRLRKIDDNVILIFVTNMAQFALEGYSVDAVDFIVKPVQYEPFRMKMEKALKIFLARTHLDDVMISVENGTRKIFASEILYVEVSNHDLYYHTKSGEYKVKSSLKSAISSLDGLPFSRCNSCYLVNLCCVESIEKDFVVMSNGDKLKMPRSRRKEFLNELGSYLSGAFK